MEQRTLVHNRITCFTYYSSTLLTAVTWFELQYCNAPIISYPLEGTPGKYNFLWGLLGGLNYHFTLQVGNEGGLVSVSLCTPGKQGLCKRNRSISSCLTSIIERLPYRRTQAHFLLVGMDQNGYEPLNVENGLLQCLADFHPEIWIARLPNQTEDKLKGRCFFLWHSIKDPFKIQVLTAK